MRASARRLCSTFSAAYRNLTERGQLRPDPRQYAAVEIIDQLERDLQTYEPPVVAPRKVDTNSWSLGNVFNFSSMQKNARPEQGVNGLPRGLYLFGGVGCGKTMLVELFFERSPLKQKRRDHFHEFMNDFHKRAFSLRAERKDHGDTVVHVADQISEEAKLLFVDEFQVTDIADAVVLRRLFARLFENGVVLLATSNRHPDDLYKNGLQRSLFLPFIPLLKSRCIVHDMHSSTDYRLLGTPTQDLYRVRREDPEKADALIEETFRKMTAHEQVSTTFVDVLGRQLQINRATTKGIAYFTFQELCELPLSAADYIAICEVFHTIFVQGIPRLKLITNRNVARRFINFIDEVYDHKVKLVCSADEPVSDLMDRESVSIDDEHASEEIFAADRTVSRLLEMQSDSYLRQPWRRGHTL